jgi:type II secretory pathway pseudopilin PulG
MNERGFAMAALLVAMSVMGIMLGVLLPAWRTQVQREREAELIFRGQQYAQAIERYSRRYGGFPTTLDALTSQNNRFLRKAYKDPITDKDFQIVYFGQVALAPPQGGAAGLQGRAGVAGTPQPGLQGLQAGRGAAQPSPPVSPARGNQPGIVPIPAGQFGQTGGPIIGVVSTSKAESLRVFNGRQHYNEWLFVATAATQQAGAATGGGAGARGRGQQPQPGPNAPTRGNQQGDPNGRGIRGRGVQPGRGNFPGPGGPGRGFPGQGVPGPGVPGPGMPGRF